MFVERVWGRCSGLMVGGCVFGLDRWNEVEVEVVWRVWIGMEEEVGLDEIKRWGDWE